MGSSETDITTVGQDGAKPIDGDRPRRINVAVTPDMMAAVERLVDREGVSLTEAVRRLVLYGDVVYRSVREQGQSMFFRTPEGKEREVLLI